MQVLDQDVGLGFGQEPWAPLEPNRRFPRNEAAHHIAPTPANATMHVKPSFDFIWAGQGPLGVLCRDRGKRIKRCYVVERVLFVSAYPAWHDTFWLAGFQPERTARGSI